MKTLIILAHPNIEQSVVNKTWIASLPAGSADVHVHDLYKIYPDWKIDVAAEQKLMESHDRIILQFPIFWFNMPPLLKKWIDEVFTYGWCYGPGGDKLEGKEIGAAVSTGGPEFAYQMDGQNAYPLGHYLSFMGGITKFVRGKHKHFHVFYGALSGDPIEEALKENSKKYVAYVTKK